MQAKQLSLKPAAAYGAVSRHPRPRGLLRRGKHGSLTRLTCSKVSTEMFHRSGISRISVFAYELLLRFRSFQFDRANVHAIERAAKAKPYDTLNGGRRKAFLLKSARCVIEESTAQKIDKRALIYAFVPFLGYPMNQIYRQLCTRNVRAIKMR